MPAYCFSNSSTLIAEGGRREASDGVSSVPERGTEPVMQVYSKEKHEIFFYWIARAFWTECFVLLIYRCILTQFTIEIGLYTHIGN